MEWLTTSWEGVGIAVVTGVAVYLAVIVFTRLAGLRSFSKMSSFDFAITVALGSIVASTVVSRETSVASGVVSLAVLYGCQLIVARLRVILPQVEALVDNRPVLLMKEGQMLEGAMRANGVSRSDLLAKLREANVLRLEQARAVILETTGDISVLHGDPGGDRRLDDVLLEGVRNA